MTPIGLSSPASVFRSRSAALEATAPSVRTDRNAAWEARFPQIAFVGESGELIAERGKRLATSDISP